MVDRVKSHHLFACNDEVTHGVFCFLVHILAEISHVLSLLMTYASHMHLLAFERERECVSF